MRKFVLAAMAALLLLGLPSCAAVTKVSPLSTVVPTSQPPVPSLPSLSEVVDKVLPTVVYIFVETNQTDSKGDIICEAGSGVILRSNGYILTNRHVVADAKTVTVTLYDRRTFSVPLTDVWLDDVVDLAVVRIMTRDLPTLKLGDPDTVNVGDWVVAIGHGMGWSPVEGGATVTKGIVSNLERSIVIGDVSYYDLIQSDAPINPGNSGGPLVNLAGDVIGINTAEDTSGQNITYAINVGTAGHIFEDLATFGEPRHAYFGANLTDVTEYTRGSPREGAVIVSTEADGPAQQALFESDDIILAIDSYQVRTAAGFVKELWRHEPGDVVEITFWRNGTQSKIALTLADRPRTNAVGLMLASLPHA